ncbi:MAG: asparagine synthase (glutamine-hydrolyzing) [Pseudomonadota bacterium]
MCGFSGYVSREFDSEQALEILGRMGDAIRHRGPDSGGVWHSQEAGVGLAHRRLSIVDLSIAGNQPMHSPGGQFVLAYNGEIYNHISLRSELEQQSTHINWRGHSDTETLLAGFETWGVKETIKKAAGMFAFALWDSHAKVLTLGRDRLGEKPLYFGWHNDTLLFGSELRSLKAHPSFNAKICRDSLCLFLRHNYVPTPYSIYEGISKLEPGTLLTIDTETKRSSTITYWSAIETAISSQQNHYKGSAQEIVDELDGALRKAVAQQMMSDVPLGAFLSGGIDSSSVVALMQTQSMQPVKTFSIGFHEQGFNEAEYAKLVAEHLGTEHTELYVTDQEALAVVPKLPDIYDEPFADSSQVPTYLVSKLAKEHVTVALSGDGGDELFCGYSRYELSNRLWSKLSHVPVWARSLAADAVARIPQGSLNSISAMGPVATRVANFGDKIKKGAGVISSTSPDELYYALLSHHRSPSELVIDGVEPQTKLTCLRPDLGELTDVERMMAFDATNYLPDDILVKVDRAAMSVSLETRVPFLHHEVFEFAWRLPLDSKLRGNVTKWPLRELLARHVPRALFERPKMGFGVPYNQWLRGPLREWASELLDSERLAREGFFRPEPVVRIWEEHLSGKRDCAGWLWSILMFQAWLESENY